MRIIHGNKAKKQFPGLNTELDCHKILYREASSLIKPNTYKLEKPKLVLSKKCCIRKKRKCGGQTV